MSAPTPGDKSARNPRKCPKSTADGPRSSPARPVFTPEPHTAAALAKITRFLRVSSSTPSTRKLISATSWPASSPAIPRARSMSSCRGPTHRPRSKPWPENSAYPSFVATASLYNSSSKPRTAHSAIQYFFAKQSGGIQNYTLPYAIRILLLRRNLPLQPVQNAYLRPRARSLGSLPRHYVQ